MTPEQLEDLYQAAIADDPDRFYELLTIVADEILEPKNSNLSQQFGSVVKRISREIDGLSVFAQLQALLGVAYVAAVKELRAAEKDRKAAEKAYAQLQAVVSQISNDKP